MNVPLATNQMLGTNIRARASFSLVTTNCSKSVLIFYILAHFIVYLYHCYRVVRLGLTRTNNTRWMTKREVWLCTRLWQQRKRKHHSVIHFWHQSSVQFGMFWHILSVDTTRTHVHVILHFE